MDRVAEWLQLTLSADCDQKSIVGREPRNHWNKSFLRLELIKKEDLRRKKNIIVHKAPQTKATESADRMKDNLKLINDLCKSTERDASKVKSCTRLGEKLEEKDNIEPNTTAENYTRNYWWRWGIDEKLEQIEVCKTRIQEPEKITRPKYEGEKMSHLLYKEQKTAEEFENYIHLVKGDKTVRLKKSDVNVYWKKAAENNSSSGFVTETS